MKVVKTMSVKDFEILCRQTYIKCQHTFVKGNKFDGICVGKVKGRIEIHYGKNCQPHMGYINSNLISWNDNTSFLIDGNIVYFYRD